MKDTIKMKDLDKLDKHFAEHLRKDPAFLRRQKFEKFFEDPQPIDYIKKGYKIIPIPKGSKRPALKDWNNLKIDESNVSQYFNGDQNIGLVTGKQPSGEEIICIDLDTKESEFMGYHLLPQTGMVSGRGGEDNTIWKRSHYFYVGRNLKTTIYTFRTNR